MKSTSKTFNGNNVPKLTKILFPWSGIFRDACYALVGTFLMQYAISSGVLSTNPDTFKSQYGVITIAMVIALLWDGINDPIMGFVLEKCHFKAGKFRPWILIGALGNAVCVFAMFAFPMMFSGLRGWGYVTFMIIMYLLWDLFFTMNDIGYWSMLPALTNDPEQRAKLTTQTAIAASIGAFMMNIAMFILPGTFSGASTIQIYGVTGVAIALFFLGSQAVVYFLCEEKERDAKQEEISEQSSILDLFKVVATNKQLLYATIGLMLYYFGNYIITGIGQNYFYMVFGYGGGNGGMVATAIAAIYVIATIVAQAFYPMLAKKYSKQKLLTMASIVIFASYIAFFFIAFPVFGEQPLAFNTPDPENIMWVFGGSMFLYYLFAFLFFGGSGIYYLVNLVMFQDAIDYNEWKYGERKESICFAWRPLDVKLASGFNRILQYVTFALTGTALFINKISTVEGEYNANIQGVTDKTILDAETLLRDTTIEASRKAIERSQLVWFGVIIIGTILAVFIASYCILHFGYKIDENMEKMIVEELEERHKKNAQETNNTATLEQHVKVAENTNEN